MKRNQSGSAHVVIIIALVLGLIGALGYIFWKNFSDSETSEREPTSELSRDNAKTEAKQTEAYKGERFTSLGGSYSIKVPNGWKLTNATNEGSNDSFDRNYLTSGPGIEGKLTYDEAAAPSVSNSELGGWGGSAEIFTVSIQDALPEGASAGTEFKLDDGTIGKMQEMITPARPDDEIYPSTDDFYSYRYLFQAKGKIVQVNFDIYRANKPPYETIIGDVVRTLVIN